MAYRFVKKVNFINLQSPTRTSKKPNSVLAIKVKVAPVSIKLDSWHYWIVRKANSPHFSMLVFRFYLVVDEEYWKSSFKILKRIIFLWSYVFLSFSRFQNCFYDTNLRRITKITLLIFITYPFFTVSRLFHCLLLRKILLLKSIRAKDVRRRFHSVIQQKNYLLNSSIIHFPSLWRLEKRAQAKTMVDSSLEI